MDLYELKPGDRVRIGDDDVIAEVVKPTEDGQWILVRYLENPSALNMVGTEDLCSEDEVVEVVPGPRS